jgi:predicted pyridoxine 5'-phosphate oxidase superfamily flavin-nucleotide-binding protein
MADHYLHTLLTPAVREAQRRAYGRGYPTRTEPPEPDVLTEEEQAFIEARDSFYLATVTENGWPYVQHRGGPAGFLRVLGPDRIGFADYGGNRQLISAGSLGASGRVSLFLMDYPRRQRLKILGLGTVRDAREHPGWVDAVAPPSGHPAQVERIIVIQVIGHDWNCPKFITPRYTAAEVEALLEPLRARIAELEGPLDGTGNEGR